MKDTANQVYNMTESCMQDDLVKALKETVIKNRETVDCATLKDIEQRRCESAARAVVQLQKHIDSDVEVAKGALMDVQREAADVTLYYTTQTLFLNLPAKTRLCCRLPDGHQTYAHGAQIQNRKQASCSIVSASCQNRCRS